MKFSFDISENKIIHNKNKGMDLESEINKSNIYYKENNIALIYKKPTPVKIVKCFDKKIIEAYFAEPSTTDYCGVYQGKYIDFEAKETASNTSFPLSNISPNQIDHINQVIKNKGIAFIIVLFTELDKYFLLKGEDFLSFLSLNNRQSIPINFFLEKGYEIKRGLNPPLDFIQILEKIY